MAEALNEVEALNFAVRAGLRTAGARVPPDRGCGRGVDGTARRDVPRRWPPTDQIIGQVRATYSGQGGPLMPITMSTRGEEPDAMSLRANEVLAALDELNLHRIAAEQLPFPCRWVQLAHDLGLRLPARSDQWRAAASCRDGLRRSARHADPGRWRWHRDFRRPPKRLRPDGGDPPPFGLTTRYAHMSRLRVSEGERVSRGERIGDMGNTGRSTGTHLHYEVRRSGDPVNPMTFITAGRDVF
jgi:hypothetical protein